MEVRDIVLLKQRLEMQAKLVYDAFNSQDRLMDFIFKVLVLYFQGGMYMLQLMDNYAATYSTLIIGLCECIALGWIYGE